MSEDPAEMWRPESAGEIERAATAGDLAETPSFEVKEALPQPKRNADIAIDVSAMTPEGGQILIGVAKTRTGSRRSPSRSSWPARRIGSRRS
jgi:hypothetical protein